MAALAFVGAQRGERIRHAAVADDTAAAALPPVADAADGDPAACELAPWVARLELLAERAADFEMEGEPGENLEEPARHRRRQEHLCRCC